MKGELGSFLSPPTEVESFPLAADTAAGTVGYINASGQFAIGAANSTGKAGVTLNTGKAGESVSVLFVGIVHVMSTAVGKSRTYVTFGAAGTVAPTTDKSVAIGMFAEECTDANVDVAVRFGSE